MPQRPPLPSPPQRGRARATVAPRPPASARRASAGVVPVAGAALIAAGLLIPLVAGLTSGAGRAEEDYAKWPPLRAEFPSTGGDGTLIRGYAPVVSEGRCRTDFEAVTPDGTVYRNEVVFDAVPAQGGVLCTNGAWRAKDGSASGTTPFRVFIKDGISRASP